MCLCFIIGSTIVLAEEVSSPPKKTILILSSKGGGGHIAAANTLHQLVGEEYNLKVVQPIDQLRIWGVPSGEQFYNSVLRNGWIRSMNFIVRHVAPPLFRSRLGKLEKIISSYIDNYKPDLVISLIPFVNYPATEAARKKEVPYLLITTDNDLTKWVFEMQRVKHKQFKVTIGTDLPMTRGILMKKNVPSQAIETIGLPLRLEFMAAKDKEGILEEFQFPKGKQIVLIMMGGAGGKVAYEYAKKIGRLRLDAHLVVVAGRNNGLKRDLERLKLHESNSITVLGFTDRVSDIMAVSDVVITKPGPGTLCEAMAMKLPILIDNTGSSLFWERTNVDMILGYGIGDRIRHYKDVKKILTRYLKNEKVKEQLKSCFNSVPQNEFHLRIRGVIQEMIQANQHLASETESRRPVETLVKSDSI